jgi:CubicO group peptidase (beta-lactamase class C family)
MSSGLEWSEGAGLPNDETRLYWKWSPYQFVLGRPIVAPPGAHFNYNSGGTAVLADILTRATGKPLKDLARESLFEPLGIGDWEWVADLHGRPMAFTGLRMRPRDMAKLGRLVVEHGRWQGKPIVSADWVAESLRPHIATGFDGLQYGYQWWAGTVAWQGRSLPWSAAFGNGGQRVFVVPDLDLSVVITAGAYDDIDATRRINALLMDIVATVEQ